MINITSERLDQLFEKRASLERKMSELKDQIANTNSDINAIAAPVADSTFKRESKIDGTVRFAIDSKIYKAEISKTVSYDSDELQRIAGTLPFEQSAELFKVKFDISAKSFDAAEGELRAALTKARTVKYGAMKITQV